MHRFLAVSALAVLLLAPAALGAQEQPQGVRLGLRYQAEYQPGFVVLPFSGAGADVVRAIIRQDLDFSDRFEMKDPDAGVRAGEAVNTKLWKERGADYVLDGALTAGGGGSALRLALYDAVYGQKKGEHTFALPPAGSAGFRMAVHAVADEVVRWATGEPGAAATRIAFVQQGRGAKEVYLVDFDGENVQRVTSDGSIALSPAWSPDGARLAFTSYKSGSPLLYERDLATGRDRLLSDRQGINITPSYAPDGRALAFATTVAGATEVVLSDLARGGVQQLTQGRRFDSLSPSFSPDGRRVAFVSNRLGEPHIYVMQLGGEPRLVSEYVYGGRGYNVSPDWSPKGDFIAYHSRVNGAMQLMMVGPGGGTPRLLTNAGNNEDPSWAPDGRHVVFSSPDRDGGGLFVLDTVSGRVRPLLRGRGFGLPAWSPRLARASS